VSIVPGTVYYLNTTTYISIGEYAGSGGASVDPMVAIDPTFAKASDYTLTLSPDLSPGPPKPTSGSIHLSSGWNLVSLPAQPSNTAIASVLSGIKGTYEVVWAYPNQAWQVYDPYDTVGSTLTKMQAGMGYWIKMSSAKTLSVSGLTPSPSISLASGWNLVGYNGASCATASTALSGLTGLQVSWGYPSQGWQFYDPANSSASGLTQLCPGAGYWVDVNGAATWSGW
jgi:hypothetical protein